jgi:hypothetical protein
VGEKHSSSLIIEPIALQASSACAAARAIVHRVTLVAENAGDGHVVLAVRHAGVIEPAYAAHGMRRHHLDGARAGRAHGFAGARARIGELIQSVGLDYRSGEVRAGGKPPRRRVMRRGEPRVVFMATVPKRLDRASDTTRLMPAPSPKE